MSAGIQRAVPRRENPDRAALSPASPNPQRIPSVAPLIIYERCYGGDTLGSSG
jgi:hypothetical protein